MGELFDNIVPVHILNISLLNSGAALSLSSLIKMIISQVSFTRGLEVYVGSVGHGVQCGHGELGTIVHLHISRCTGTE